MKIKKIIKSSIALALVAVLVSGCGAKTEESSSNSDKGSAITIKHALGETKLGSKPERIATIGWENQDTPLALGVAPVGVSMANYGKVTSNKLHVWTDDAFKKLGVDKPNVYDDVDGINYEAIADSKPDVILAAYSGITKEEYETLSKIAPVVAYKNKPWQTLWRDQTIQNAEGMGMKSEGEAKVKEVEKLIEEKTAKYPNLKGVKAAFAWITPDDFSKFYIYLPTDPRAAYLNDLGFVLPESVKELSKGTDDFNIILSRENTDKLNDVELLVVYGNDKLLSDLQKDPLMSKIPAIKNGAVVLIDPASELAGATTPSILSIPSQIDTYLDLLQKAQEKIK